MDNAPSYTMSTALLFTLLPALYFGFMPLIFIGTAMLISLLANHYIQGKLGGVTGDTYGAVTELTEMLLLGLAACM